MTDGVRRLSHDEAEMLISARMDEQLDRGDSRALLVHLQTCESCRAFAVQSEVLGRELAALPVLPGSAVVDRQMREYIAKGNRRWSLASLLPGTAGNSGLRVALGALAVLTLVSVFLLVRMSDDSTGGGNSIEAPSGGVAQQLQPTTTAELAMAGQTTLAGPTETPRVVTPKTPPPSATKAVETEAAGEQATETQAPVEPTQTLDSNFLYTIDNSTQTSAAEAPGATRTPQLPPPTATGVEGQVAVAAIGAAESTPVEGTPAEPPPPTRDDASSDSETPQDVATATPEPPIEETATATPTEPPPDPTMTPTPVVISVDATETPDEPATPPPADADGSDITSEQPAEATSAPDQEGSQASPTEQPSAEPAQPPVEGAAESPTPTPQPFAQPTIAPISGGPSDTQGNLDNATSPPIVPNDGSDVESGSTEVAQGNDSPTIVSVDSTEVPDGVGSAGASSQAAESQSEDSTAIPTVDESAEPAGLDLSDTVAELPSGTSSPLGRLEFSPGMDLYAVIAPDSQLAVADLDGDLVVSLGQGDLPVWSGNAMMFRSPGDNGSVVGIWNADSGELSYVPSSDDEPSSDLPIGGDGSAFYFLRTFPDRPGAMEIRSASVDGADNGAIWTSDSTSLGGARPTWSSAGILLPTDSEWLLVDTGGEATTLGENPYGSVGAPVLSPGEGLMAYSAGDQVIVAWTTDPGTAVAIAPLGSGSGGYAFSTSGEEIVVSDGSSLHVVSYEGDDLGTLSGNQPIGGVYWISDTIYYLQIGEDAALKSTSLDAIQGA